MSNGSGTLFVKQIWDLTKRQLTRETRLKLANLLWDFADREDCDLHNLDEIDDFRSKGRRSKEKVVDDD